MFTDPRVAAEIRDEFGTFASSDETYADVDAMADKKEMDPIKWWNFHGAMTTHLQKLAIKLLSQVCFYTNYSNKNYFLFQFYLIVCVFVTCNINTFIAGF